jgi:flagellar biosynthesis/type III secretory pathway chaperone
VTDTVLAQAAELTRLLHLEFEALKNQDLDLFESLQPGKSELLGSLGESCPPAQALQNDAAMQPLRDLLLQCRDLHRRNAMLIERKLDTIRGALHSLRTGENASPLEVYDRLGQVARFNRGRGYQEA